MKFGWKQDQESNSDLKFESVSYAFTPSLNSNSGDEYILKEYTSISNQLGLSSCVANATADSLEILLGQQGKLVQLSRLFIYWNARVYTKDTDKDEGTYVRNAFASLANLGVCSEDLWQYDESKVFAQPNIFAYGQANSNKIDSYYRIDDDKRLDQIEQALKANHPVVFGTAIPDTFTKYYSQDNVVWEPQSKNIGNHAMIIIGVRYRNSKREFLIKNSWGTSWGNNGKTWMSESYIAWDQSNDFWVPTLMPLLKT